MGHEGIKTIKAKWLIMYRVLVEDHSLSIDPCGVHFSFKITAFLKKKTSFPPTQKENHFKNTKCLFL